MNIEQIKSIIKAMDDTPVSELEYCEGNARLRVVKCAGPKPIGDGFVQNSASTPEQDTRPVSIVAPDKSNTAVTAPLPGIFYRSASPGELPFVEEGADVVQGQTLALIEAMKMLTPIKAPADGIIRAILAGNDTLVDAGAALFEIES